MAEGGTHTQPYEHPFGIHTPLSSSMLHHRGIREVTKKKKNEEKYMKPKLLTAS